MTQYVKKLPSVFQTTTEKKFFDATFDQVFSKKDNTLLAGYLGRRVAGDYNAISDFYIPEPTKNRTWWQLEATAYSKDASSNKTNIFFYEDLLNYIDYYGGDTSSQNRLFESEYYSFAPPIDYDMFTNYQNYYWIEQGLPTIVISGVSSEDIIGKTTYTTPPTATPPNFTLTTGLTIQIQGDTEYSVAHTVENIGGSVGIRLVPMTLDFTTGSAFEFLPWDNSTTLSTGRVIKNINWDGNTWESEPQPSNGDYITIERGSLDKNAWSRSNKWYHIDAITSATLATGSLFPTNSTRALRPIIQFIADLVLYNSGTQFKSNITYGFRDISLDQPLLLSNLNGIQTPIVNSTYGTNFIGGEIVVFFNDISTNQQLYKAVVSNGILTFIKYLTPITTGDITFISESGPYNAGLRGEVWYYDNGIWQEAFNDKTYLNQPPLFQLYDHLGIRLDDIISYPTSTFKGSKIFSYSVDVAPSAPLDPVLGFAIIYTALGQASDILFENNLITDRYTYSTNVLPITGYYYYQTLVSPVLYNSWNLYDPTQKGTLVLNVPNDIPVSKQRVIDNFVVNYGSKYQFGISVVPYGYPATPDIIVIVNGVEVQNSLFHTNGYDLVIINNQVYVDLSFYISALQPISGTPPVIIETQTYTQTMLSESALGYFEIPQQLDANPTQQEISTISGSNLIQHFSSIISKQIGEIGSAFGGPNNYRDTIKNRSLGTFILQNVTPVLKAMLPMSDINLDLISAIRFSSDEYTKFKNKYLRTALQLINQGFSPIQYYNNTIIINSWVEEILKIVNVSNEFSNAFAYSYMIANGSSYANETDIIPTDGQLVLTNYIDLTDTRNSIYIYDTTIVENLLVVGIDYDIISTNLEITIQFNLLSPKIFIGNTVAVNLYKNPLPAYIPSTPTKVGTYPTFLPRIETDFSYLSPASVIIGHDGSRTLAYGDYRDQLLLELEKRIYNLLQPKFAKQYNLPVRIESVKSGYFRQTRYTKPDFLGITESYINKWAAKNKANYRANDWGTSSTTPSVVSSFIPGIGNIWKLYNYTDAVTTSGVHLNLPGNWKGIFQYCYDTIYPDTRPWEMLGFSSQPDWWISEYGIPVQNVSGESVWASAASGLNNMWQDLENGIIRQGATAIYDPDTLLPLPQSLWQRPGLAAIIPVNSAGEIISVMTLFNIAFSGNYYEPYDNFDIEWAYGDGSPVEQAWYASSAYAFSVQEILYLTKPAQYCEFMWDTVGTEISAGMITIPDIESPVRSSVNWQFVQNDAYSATTTDSFFSWMRPKNKDQYVHAENIDGTIQVRFGYQRWISDRVSYLNMNITDTFGQKIRTLDVNLANKFAGFTNKDTTNLYIEAVSPTSTRNTLIIPSTNYDVILYTSPVVATYSYSGIIIRALANGTFNVYGYDLLNSSFITLDRADSSIVNITIGGTPASFQYFSQGATYNIGDIVRYNSVYYQSLVVQTSNKFISANFRKLSSLPISGGVSVDYRPESLTTTTTYPYGVTVNSVQEVFDLMIGYGAYLESIGWQFQNVDPTTNIVSDWLSSAKQLLFWLNTEWAPDAMIQLSPLANSANIIVSRGYPKDVETMSNGVYSILDKYGIAIPTNNITTERSGLSITVSPNTVNSGGIYYLQVNTTTTEHILIFDNDTSFGDTVYNPLLQARQERLRFNGFRSNNWYGKMEAAGYIIINNQLVPNYDTIVDSMRYFYDSNVTLDNTSLQDLGYHLIGYESKSYLDNMQVDRNVQYMFYQGSIRQKGTSQALNTLFRSNVIQTNETIVVYEEWALKLSSFGNTIEQVSTEFILNPEQNTGQVVVARLNFIPSTIGSVREINILNTQNSYNTVPLIIIDKPDATPTIAYASFSTTSVYIEGSVVNYPDKQGNENYYTSNIAQGPSEFILNNWTLILATRGAKAYAVLNSIGQISRIDVTDPGMGYLGAPSVVVKSNISTNLHDQLYAVWQGEIVKDTTTNNIIDISVDDPILWTVRPDNPEYSLQFPLTDIINYPIPNAGYVNSGDINWMSYDVTQTTINWGTTGLNPKNKDTIWVANTFTNDWSVFKMVELNDNWKIIADNNNDLVLLTDYGVSSTLSISSTTGGANAYLVPIINSSGNIISVSIVFSGIDYNINDIITSSRALPYSSLYIDAIFQITSVSLSGEIISISVLNPTTNTGYAPISNVSIVPQLWGSIGTHRTQFGNMISLQQVIDGTPVLANNYTVGILPYTTTDYVIPGTYIDPTTLITYNAYYLTTLSGNQITSTDIGNYADFTDLLLYKSMRFDTIPATIPAYIESTDNVWINNGSTWDSINHAWSTPSNLWGVYTYNLPSIVSIAPFTLFRQQLSLIDTTLFESAVVYSSVTENQLTQLPIFDPFKNILPGPVKQNITYTTLHDPARYNVTANASLFSENITFASNQVGQLWWDLSTVAYLYYEQPIALDGSETEQSNLIYRRNNWGQLFPGSVISVYEWTQSSVPPSKYTGSGTPRDISTYVQVTTINKVTGIPVTNYYFWVVNSTTQPNLTNRTMSAQNVMQMLQSPMSQGFVFFSPIQETATNNSYMFYNVLEILSYQGNNIQIKYRQAKRNDQSHTQWMFFREGDPTSIVTDQFWNKMVDSLCGYTQILPVSDGYNGIIIADNLPWDIYGWDIAPWDDATFITTPSYGLVLPVPDPKLSSGEAYGVEFRPRQTMFVSQTNALKVFSIAANALLKYIPIRDNNPAWGINLLGWNNKDSTDEYFGVYWTYTNWYLTGYENSTPTNVYQTLTEANIALVSGLLAVNDIVEVSNGTVDGRFVLYSVEQITNNAQLSFREVGIQNSAIMLLSNIYVNLNLYNLATEVRGLLNAFRTQVMIDEYLVDQNDLFFSMINYVMSEQTTPSWVFKSSYIYIKENNIALSQPTLYTPDQISNVLDFITDSKPYHTQVRDYTSSYITNDVANGTTIDNYNLKIILQFGPDYPNTLVTTPSYIYDGGTIASTITQLISQEDVYKVPLTVFDSSKIGYSSLYPYTFIPDDIFQSPAQTFITPQDIVAIQIGNEILTYGKDYFVEFNNNNSATSDGSYTVYFFNDPSSGPTPIAIILFDGGRLLIMNNDIPRAETVTGLMKDDLMVKVDVKLPINYIDTTYSAINDSWDLFDTVVNDIVTSTPYYGQSMGFGNSMWDQNSLNNVILTTNVISARENINDNDTSFIRNSKSFSGVLVYDLKAPASDTENLDVITVFVDPATKIITDILPDPAGTFAIIWIDGERIEYREKTVSNVANTWELRHILRGSDQTGIIQHIAGSTVWIEKDNIMPGTPTDNLWEAINTTPTYQEWSNYNTYYNNDIITYLGITYKTNGIIIPFGLPPDLNPFWVITSMTTVFTSVTSVPFGGIWYAQTTEALFLKQNYNYTNNIIITQDITGGPATPFPTKITNYGTPIVGGAASLFPVQITNMAPSKTSSNDPNVVLLVSGKGVNGSTIFADSSMYKHPLTNIGAVTINTSISKFGGGSMNFDTNGQSVNAAPSNQYNFGSSPFTVEAFVYISGNSADDNGSCYALIVGSTDYNYGWALTISGNSTTTGTGIYVQFNNYISVPSWNVTISQDQWHHIAWVGDGTNTWFCLDGAISPSSPYTLSNVTSMSPLYIGGSGDYLHYGSLVGNMEEVKVTNGIALYSGTSYSVPTSPF